MISTLRKVWFMLDVPFRWKLLGLTIAILGIVAMESIGIGLLYLFLGVLSGSQLTLDKLGPLSTLSQWLTDLDRVTSIQFMGVGVAVFFLIKNTYIGIVTHNQNKIIFNELSKFSSMLFSRYIRSDFSYISNKNSSEIIRNVNENTTNLYSSITISAMNIITESMTALALGCIIVATSPLGALGAALTLGLLIYLYQLVMSKRFADWGHGLNTCSERNLRFIKETLGAIKEIRAQQTEEFFERRMSDNLQKISELRKFVNISSFVPRLYVETVIIIIVFAISIFLVSQNGDDQNTLATLGMFGAIAFRLMPSGNRLLSNLGVLRSGFAAVDSLHSSLPPPAEARPQQGQPLSFQHLRLESVSYRYPNRDTDTLSHISLELSKGKSVALIGRSGAGKSTLADILLGLLSPNQGRITADDKEIQATQLCGRVAYVPQHPYFLDDSLCNNVAFGQSHDKIDESRVMAALQAAELSELVTAVGDIHTPLGENANRLSGGQRQRLALARAFYRDADLMLLDEATSALDMQTEASVTKAITNMSRDRAVLIIAHRLATIQHCDQIILLDEGRMQACGTFTELYRSHEDFRRLVDLGQLQTGSNNPAPSA